MSFLDDPQSLDKPEPSSLVELIAPNTFECGICYDEVKEDSQFIVNPCEHKFCIECSQDYFGKKIDDKQSRNINCPIYKCSNENIHQNDFLYILNEEHVQKFMKIESTLFETNMEGQGDGGERFVSCPVDGYGLYLNPERDLSFKC